jgi:hypothetical protein
MNRRKLLQGLFSIAAATVLPVPAWAIPAGNRTIYYPGRNVRSIRINIPRDVYFYEIAGQTFFPVYGASGGLTVQMCCYAFKHIKDIEKIDGADLGGAGLNSSNGVKWVRIDFSKIAEIQAGEDEIAQYVRNQIENGVKQLYA